MQRLIDRLGRRGQPPLKYHQGKAHRARTLVILQRLGAVELLADVAGHLAVELGLGVGELVGHRVGDALRKKRRAVELQQALFDHAPHQVGDIDLVNPIAEAPLKAVAIEQGHEELEVLFLAVVGRGGHQQEVTGQRAEELAQAVAPRVLHLPAKEGCRELVGLIADHEVPTRIGCLKQLLHILVAGQLIEAGDDQIWDFRF